MPDMPVAFETLRSALDDLEVPAGEARRLRWVVDERLGAAKTASGDFEIFLLGDALEARSAIVGRCLEHGTWRSKTDDVAFDATRVVLPPDPHFAAIAALIATELVRVGMGAGVPTQEAFTEVEPIIELAIQRGSMADDVLLGLVSELIVLRTILRSSNRTMEQKAVLVGTWRGWQQGRDFVIGSHAVEVKATRGLASSHAFSGLHQLEEQTLPDGGVEVLHLLSIGLQEAPEGTFSLPGVVEDLLSELGGPVVKEPDLNPLQTQLLAWILQYGAGGRGYRHLSMRKWPQYQAQFALSFSPRLYRISDPEMRLLQRALVEDTYLRPDSVTFDATFPARVSAFNPADRWQVELANMADTLLQHAHVPIAPDVNRGNLSGVRLTFESEARSTLSAH